MADTGRKRLLIEGRGSAVRSRPTRVSSAGWGPFRTRLAALAAACGLDKPAPAWWVNFRVIDEGSWGSSGGVLSILPLPQSGVFTQERVKAVRAALGT
ncbi:hypothetical protein [Streptomyces sp. CA-179760]|uniref:hypothetical protein n=1 Tax=Streptomyces sp. CA-179760 TaxID=3240054 RepID=UPI003D8FACF2